MSTMERSHEIQSPQVPELEGWDELSNREKIEDAAGVFDDIENGLVGTVHMDSNLRTISTLASGMQNAHMLLEADPGLGKTTMAKAIADTLGGTLGRIQGQPDNRPSDITGYYTFNPKTGDRKFIQGPVFNSVVLADELNRNGEREQAGFIEAMEEGQVTVDGVTHKLPEKRMFIGTQNPEDYQEGTRRIITTLRDRLGVSYYMQPYDASDMIAAAEFGLNPVKAERKVEVEDFEIVARALMLVKIPDQVKQRAAEIIVDLREQSEIDKEFTILAGARPLIQTIRFASALALSKGKSVVNDTHVDYIAPFVLGHRVALKHNVRQPFSEILSRVTDQHPQSTEADLNK